MTTTSALALLRSDLASAGYGVDALGRLWGPQAADALFRAQRVPARRALSRLSADDRPALVTLARLFVLSDEVSGEALAAAFPTLGLEGAIGLGLVRRAAEGRYRAALDLRPYDFIDSLGVGSWWLLSDLGELALGRPLDEDHVLGVGGASLTLSGLMLPTPVGSVLDLGTGCGIQAMHAARHADRVVATDISARALEIARLNAELNGIDSIEFRLGSLYEPVAGERFDQIVSNPPFVITPRVDGVPTYEYRDGGLVGDAIVRAVVTGAAEHLNPGGTVQMLGNWEYHAGAGAGAGAGSGAAVAGSESGPTDGLERVGSWCDAAGLEVWAMERERQDAASYAETWIRDGGTKPGTPAFDALEEAWLDDFEARGVESVGFGYLVLRRPSDPSSGQPRLRRLERVESAVGDNPSGLGDHVAACLAGSDWQRGLDDAALASALLRVAPDVTEERHYWPGSDDPTVMTLRQGGGFSRSVPLGTALAAVVGASDGELSVAAVCAALAQILSVDEAELRAEVLPRLRALLDDGMLLPPAEVDASSDDGGAGSDTPTSRR